MPTTTELPNVTHNEAQRSITYRWMRPEVSDTRAVELHIRHDRDRRCYAATLAIVDVEQHDGYVVTRFMVQLGTSIGLRRTPTSRYSRKGLAAFADEVYADLMTMAADIDIDPRVYTLWAGQEYRR